MPKAFSGIDVCEQRPALEALEVRVTPSVRYDSYDAATTLALELDAWTLLPDIVAAWSGRKLAMLRAPRGWDAPYTISAVFRRGQARTPVFDALIAELRAVLASLSSP